MSKVGIVILNYNDYKTTRIMLDTIKSYRSIDHIVVVDNNSKDNSYELLKEYESKKIDIIKAKHNNGYSAGNNVGVKHLIKKYNVDYVIISNPDIIVESEVITTMKKQMDKNDDIKVLSPVIHELSKIKRGWMLPTYYGEMITICNTRQRFHKNYGLYPESHYNELLSEVDVVSGCFFMIRADVIKEVGYFDEGTFLYYEENILGNILKKKGYKTYVLNSVSVTHNLSISVDKSIKKLNKYKILIKSLMYYERKYNKRNIFAMIFLNILFVLSYIFAYIKNLFR